MIAAFRHLNVVALLLASLIPLVKAGEYNLFNIDDDPDEGTNLFYDDSYTDVIDYFKERMDYWADNIQSPEIPDWSDADSTFKELGGIGAWLTSDYEPIDIPQLYNYKYAPHIVFVLVDDWGWNDIGWKSTYLSWTTPTIDKLAEEGVRLTNHYSHELCVPTRGALLTGRFSIRLGLWNQDNQQDSVLPLNETTIAQELKSAGYRTYMVGKWDLGYAATQYYPTSRGFGDFYGFYTSAIDYYTKKAFTSSAILADDDDGTYLDLHTGDLLVKDERELSSDYHSAALLEEKAEEAIQDWYENYSNQPFFLYYALQLIHGPYQAPERFMQRCGAVDMDDDYEDITLVTHCAMNVMLDEVIANLTCTLQQFDAYENTIFILASDNGGQEDATVGLSGNNYPLRGAKGSYWRGGVSTTAFIHSRLLPESAWGTEYSGNVHITGTTAITRLRFHTMHSSDVLRISRCIPLHTLRSIPTSHGLSDCHLLLSCLQQTGCLPLWVSLRTSSGRALCLALKSMERTCGMRSLVETRTRSKRRWSSMWMMAQQSYKMGATASITVSPNKP
jgi:hypothetical protein